MKNDRTLTMIKPDAVSSGNSGNIIQKIIDSGFKIIAMKLTKLNREDAERFYEIHKERNFYDELVNFMTNGPIVAAILEKSNAVNDFRNLIGNTNSEDAIAGTIRNLYGKSIERNAIHGSDSDENAEIECSFFFSESEIFNV